MLEMRLERIDEALLALKKRRQLINQLIRTLEKYFRTGEKTVHGAEIKK